MTLTEHQIQAFNQLREELLSKIDLFKISIDFPANYEQSGNAFPRPWLDRLEIAINKVSFLQDNMKPNVENVKKFREDSEETEKITEQTIASLSAIQCGVILVTQYFQPIRDIFMNEFKVLPEPFDVIIPEYEQKVIKLFETNEK